jgi:hypothetical protein
MQGNEQHKIRGNVCTADLAGLIVGAHFFIIFLD